MDPRTLVPVALHPGRSSTDRASVAAVFVLLAFAACDGRKVEETGQTGQVDTQESRPDEPTGLMETAETEEPGETGESGDTEQPEETGETGSVPTRCGVEGVPSDGAPWGTVSLVDSEIRFLNWSGKFAAGDHDGDGCTDIMFSTSGTDYDDNAGTNRIFAGPLLGDVDTEEDWTYTLLGEPDDWAYNPFTGDVNGDGLADWIIAGAEIDDGLGGVYVVHGPVSTSMELAEDSAALLYAQQDMKGSEDHESADLDGDGIDDLLISAADYTNGDQYTGVYVLPGPFAGTELLADTDTIITPGSDHAGLGYAASAGGDLNGDGLPEVTLGSGSYSTTGGVWVFEPPLSGTIVIADADATLLGEGGDAGGAVSSGGDVDGDGYGDLLVGAEDYSNISGRAYLVLGPLDGSYSLRNADAIIEADGLSAEVGKAVSLEQDLDADGRAEVVVGAPGAAGAPNDGAVFVFYETFTGTVDAFDEAEAVLYNGSGDYYRYTGSRLAPAGDVNGDGFDDLHIHGRHEYLVFGGER